jgi:tripartite-type tricarboxylate transporter receptor subunit TctC
MSAVRIAVSACLCLGLPQVALPAHAQGYPERPVRLVVPLAAGGAMDLIARSVGAKLSEALGQTIVVDNRGGGGGTIGAELVAAAAPDGYTLIMMSATSVIRPLLYPARYDLLRDFAPISQVSAQPYLLVVHPTLPVKSVADLVAHAKANPGKLNYASSGQGSIIHLATELLNVGAGIRTIHVPYKGMGAAYPDLLAGHVQMALGSIVSAQPHVRAGRLRGIAVTSPQRSKSSPEFPTIAESGVKGYAVTNWYGLLAPAKTPGAIVKRLNRETGLLLQQPDTVKRFAADGAEAVGSTPEAFAAHIRSESRKWAEVIKSSGIRGD